MNKAGGYFGKKVEYKGHKFDSTKEADFFRKFIEESGLNYKVHPSFELIPKFEIFDGLLNIRSMRYTPDFVIYDEQGELQHVLDIKNSFNAPYGVDTAASNRFKLFAKVYNVPVEVVVPRTHDFKMKIMGTTKKFEPIVLNDLNYNLRELIDNM